MLSSVNSNLSDTFTKLENRSSADPIPKKNSKDSQAKEKTLSKEQLRKYTKDGGSDASGTVSNAQTDFLNHLFGSNDENSESVEKSNIKKHDVESKLVNAKSQEPQLRLLGTGKEDPNLNLPYGGESISVLNSFDSLANAVGAVNDKISKEQLIAYLQTLKSSSSEVPVGNEQIAFVKNLIAKFDTIADGGKYITSLDGIKEPQDPETVTPEQLEFPIDLRV